MLKIAQQTLSNRLANFALSRLTCTSRRNKRDYSAETPRAHTLPNLKMYQEHYEDFCHDIFEELAIHGEIEELNVCVQEHYEDFCHDVFEELAKRVIVKFADNLADHMNVYVK